jgi:FemAB-related protein (PEP-CTERM system-associated)
VAIAISLLDPGEEGAWDKFVNEASTATFFHLSGWKTVIERAFGHKTYYLVARRDGKIDGVLPLTHMKSFLFGNTLISNAFCVQGGIVASSADTYEALKEEVVRLGRTLNVSCIELRAANASQSPWQVKDGLYFAFRRQLEASAEATLKTLPRERRRLVRVATQNGLKSVIDGGVDRLHHIYAHSVRQLGTPVFSRRYFELLKDVFRDSCEVLTVEHGLEPIASVMNFYFRDEVLPYYGGGLSNARALAGNDFMYWEVMRRACERGVRVFDFGRSKAGTGAYSFKHNWGFKPTPLAYEYLTLGSGTIPETNPLNPKYQLAIRLWQRLPLSVTKVVGPAIVRSIG